MDIRLRYTMGADSTVNRVEMCDEEVRLEADIDLVGAMGQLYQLRTRDNDIERNFRSARELYTLADSIKFALEFFGLDIS